MESTMLAVAAWNAIRQEDLRSDPLAARQAMFTGHVRQDGASRVRRVPRGAARAAPVRWALGLRHQVT